MPAADTVYKGMQTAAVALVLVLAATILHMGEAAYIAFALAGAFAIHVAAARPTRRELAVSAALGAGFGTVYFVLHGRVLGFFGWQIAVTGGFLGLGSLLALASQWIWARAAEKRARCECVREAALIPLLCVCSMIAVGLA